MHLCLQKAAYEYSQLANVKQAYGHHYTQKNLIPTNGINLIHEDDTRLVVPSIVEHLPDETGTLTNVLIHNGTGHHLLMERLLGTCITKTYLLHNNYCIQKKLTLRKLQSSWLATALAKRVFPVPERAD